MGNLLLVGCVCLLQTAAEAAREAVPEALLDVEVRAVEVDSRGDLWVGVRDRGLARVRGGHLEWVAGDGLPLGVADVTEVGEQLWVAGLGGVGRRGPAGWAGLDLPLEARVVFTVSAGDDPGEVWLGTSAGAAHLTEAGWTTTGESDGLPHAVVHQVLVDPSGTVWYLCRTGAARSADGSLEVLRPDLNFRAGIIGPEGYPWFGTSGGLLRWTGSEFVSELPGVTPYPKLVASDGSVWAGSAADGVLRYDGESWTSPVLDLRGVEVFDVAEDLDGGIWIASSVGLRRIEPNGS